MSEPIIKLDTSGKASVISYNVPEPTSYAGNNVIELEFDESIFTDLAKAIPQNRKTSPSESEIEHALDNAIEHGVFDKKVFPNAVSMSSPLATIKKR